MPAVTDIWAIRQRRIRGSVGCFAGSKRGSTCLNRPRRALCGPDMLQRSGNYAGASNSLTATGVPTRPRLRPFSVAPNGPDRLRELRLRAGCAVPVAPSCRTPEPQDRRESPSRGALSGSSYFVFAGLRVPPCLSGGFVQLGSI